MNSIYETPIFKLYLWNLFANLQAVDMWHMIHLEGQDLGQFVTREGDRVKKFQKSVT